MLEYKEFEEIYEGVRVDWTNLDRLSYWLTEIVGNFYQMSEDIANLSVSEEMAIIQAKEENWKRSFSEAEVRGKMNTSEQKNKAKNRLESLKYLFTAIEWRIKILTSESSRLRPSVVPHQA